MTTISKQLTFFITLARVQATTARTFDARLTHGLNLNEFAILYYLSQSPEERMRRTDLAEKMGLTASGITRMLLPMEKLGLIKRQKHDNDARVSYVKLAPGGKTFLKNAVESAELTAEELFATTHAALLS